MAEDVEEVSTRHNTFEQPDHLIIIIRPCLDTIPCTATSILPLHKWIVLPFTFMAREPRDLAIQRVASFEKEDSEMIGSVMSRRLDEAN